MTWNQQSIDERLQRTFYALESNLNGIRAGIASTGLVENISIEVYGGQKMKLIQLAAVDVSGSLELIVKPFDSANLTAIEKGIQMSNRGFSCSFDGSGIIVRLPKLTEEVRKNLIKDVKQLGEDCKISVRQVRRDEIDKLKLLLKNKEISKDENKRYSDQIQKIVDTFISKVDDMVSRKSSAIADVN